MKSATEMAKVFSNPVARWLALNSPSIATALLRHHGIAKFSPYQCYDQFSPILNLSQVHELVQAFRDLGYNAELTDNPSVKMEIKVTLPGI
jgi:hypothetical protein